MSSTTRTTDIVVRFDGDTGKLVAAMKQAERTVSQRVGDMGKSMQRVGKSMSKYLTVPIMGVLTASAKLAIDFDKSMTKIAALTDYTKEEVDKLRPVVLAMGTQFGKSGQEAADAMYFIASSGVKGAAAVDVLRESLKASASGLGETQVVADLLTSAMNAYGPATLSAAHATDILVAAVGAGKAEPEQLAGAMSAVLPIASNMGVKFEEIAAAFAALSLSGTNADEAATQIRATLASLLQPSKGAEGQLNKMGLSAAGLRKQLKEKGLLSVLDTLRKKFKGNGAAAAEVFGNVRALTGVLDLTGRKWKQNADIFDYVSKSQGGADKAFAKTADSLGFKYTQAVNAVKNSMTGLGDTLAPDILRISKAVTALTKALNSMSPIQKTFVVNIALVVAALGPLLIMLGAIARAVESIMSLFGKLSKLFEKYPALGKALGMAGRVAGAVGTAYTIYDLFQQKKVADTSSSQYQPQYSPKTSSYNPYSGRAIGGTVNPGTSYLVGERGPELFSPTSSGFISPNGALAGGFGGAVNVTVNVHGSVIRERDLAVSVRDQIAQLMRRRGLDPSILGV